MQGTAFPVALALVNLARSLEQRPLEAYVCAWMAFMNLCQVLAARRGVTAHFGLRSNGTLRTLRVGGLKMAEVILPRQEQQIEALLASMNEDLRHRLVSHENVRFLAFRRPHFAGTPIGWDSYHQRPNGVLDVVRTLDARYPVWSPIDVELYRRYVAGQQMPEARDVLARQVLDALGTLQRNLMSAAADRAEAGDALVSRALPLLILIVDGLLAQETAGDEGAGYVE